MKELVKIYKNISNTQLSVAKYSGGCIIQGKEYIYNPITDELILKSYLKEYNKKYKRQS